MSGFLLVHKPSGITSFDVIRQLRRILGIKKLGHSGVLDRPASGLLVVGVNKATRLFELFADFKKEYEADIWLGLSTSTDDLTGELLQAGNVEGLAEQNVEHALAKYRGTFDQMPPAFSLAKKAGKELYRYALAGEAVEVDTRPVTISASELLSFETAVDPGVALEEDGTCAAEGRLTADAERLTRLARARVRLQCSGGLYVRALARDIGADLGCGGAMGRLMRTRVGPFRLEEAHTLDGLEQQIAAGATVVDLLLPLSSIARNDQRLELDGTQIAMVRMGQAISAHPDKLGTESRVFGVTEGNELVCILERSGATPQGLAMLKPTKVFL